jgi:translation initiation factor IF-3
LPCPKRQSKWNTPSPPENLEVPTIPPRSRRRFGPPEKEKYRINRRIRIREVFLIDAEGNQIGAMPTTKALKMAEEAGLDLVEVAPNSRPPVCRILDYGKFKYEQKKKQRGKPKTQSSVLKEIRVRPKIDVNDIEIKVRKAREFLEQGNKVQVTCLFRGREMAYQNLGREVLEKVVELLADVAKLERAPRMEGRRMNIMLARKPGVSVAKPRPERSASDLPSSRSGEAAAEPASEAGVEPAEVSVDSPADAGAPTETVAETAAESESSVSPEASASEEESKDLGGAA